MKFKVGDKVRLTREAIASKRNRNYRVFEFEVIWVEVRGIKDDLVAYKYKDRCYWNEYEANLELVPEEPEFEEGEMIEVSDDWKEWERRIFLYCIPNVPDKYLCVHKNYEGVYLQGWDRYDYQAWLYARKLRPQLTRKEIAEKFWVNEDFELIED